MVAVLVLAILRSTFGLPCDEQFLRPAKNYVDIAENQG